MYSYTWDSETGGLLLNSSPLQFSKEPRPVYYQELDILGFDRFWKYAKMIPHRICGPRQITITIEVNWSLKQRAVLFYCTPYYYL